MQAIDRHEVALFEGDFVVHAYGRYAGAFAGTIERIRHLPGNVPETWALDIRRDDGQKVVWLSRSVIKRNDAREVLLNGRDDNGPPD